MINNEILHTATMVRDPARKAQYEKVSMVMVQLSCASTRVAENDPALAAKLQAAYALIGEMQAVLNFYSYASCDDFADDRGRKAREATGNADVAIFRHLRI